MSDGEWAAELPAALDLGAFELLPNGLAVATGSLPDWLPLEGDARSGIELAERFPALEVFLDDAREFFERASARRLESEVWEEETPDGGRRYLQASALRLERHNLIVVRLLPVERFSYQQLYHEFQMSEEEAQRLRAVAERATRAKTDFLATMSHEIRTPLNAIIGMADVLSATPLTPEQQRCVDIFQRNGISLLNLINDILDLSKVESGKVELESAPFDLRDVISRAMEVTAGRAKERGLELRQHIGSGVPVNLMGDGNRLRQVLINLLGNAVKFTEQGHVEVRAEPDPESTQAGALRFAVTDTGAGIPAEKLGLIFESFAQADASTTRKYGGTGLGLTISRQLVELMGGRIWVESEPGAGSTFYFTAKFAEAEPVTASKEQAGGAAERLLQGLRILLADDSDDNRFLVQSYLQNAGCLLEMAENGAEAVDRFRAGGFDVVLMDVEMPVMDGLAATCEIRRYEELMRLRPTPVLALTAHAFADMAAKAREAGVTAHLTKPIRKLTLLEALAAYTGRSSRPGVTAPVRGTVKPIAQELIAQIEPGMEDVAHLYLGKRRADVETYRGAIKAGDFATLRMLGHRMKGTGGGYGFPVLSEIGGTIEQAALAEDLDRVGMAVERLSWYVENVRLPSAEPQPAKSPA